ncbi:MAG TPA: TonB-dependent receptor [Gemmatimonadales bacterium]|nr:TonB-dependent receptor [Gemmatimonadales bacterium]
MLASLLAASLAFQTPTTPDTTRPPAPLPTLEVIGRVDRFARIPGSAMVLDRGVLLRGRVFTMAEALRKVPGVHVRDEEGFGLRPNFGIRGLSPTRSTTVMLLEDGIPFTLAPYGDNAAYYHPPIERFDRIEILKGSGQILFGPRTIGGVINYITPDIPQHSTGELAVSGGSRGFLNTRARFGGSWGGAGLLVDLSRRQGEGARENIGSTLHDATLKSVLPLGADQSVVFKANYYTERSQITYSGLTEAEWAAAPRSNLFRNDSLLLSRLGGSATHRISLGAGAALTSAVYGYRISRDWWRQSSNSAERPNDASDPACGGVVNLSTTCGNQGRLREYGVAGVESRIRLDGNSLGIAHQLDAGIRLHRESQDRLQVNGGFPGARTSGPSADANSGIVEDNLRRNTAYALFAQERILLGPWTVTPGIRLEHVRYQRVNRRPVAGNPQGIEGKTSLTQVVPGLGVTLAASGSTTLFGGLHRGFSPPRTEDLINNSTGGVVELGPELSWNAELGLRSRPVAGLALEATAFRMAFDNQIIPASVAGGSGATLTSAGRTLHGGLELSTRASSAGLWGGDHDVTLSVAWTWLPVARFEGERFVFVGQAGTDVVGKVYGDQNAAGTRERISVKGNRLPYAPRHLLTASLGWTAPQGFDLSLEAVHVGGQYGDALNTTTLVADGQQGPIPAVTVWNVAANYPIGSGTGIFAAVKNATGRLFVVDRTRGLLPGMPRLVQMGVVQRF